jgi:hypothetical protein
MERMSWMGRKQGKEGRIRQEETHVCLKGELHCFDKEMFPIFHETFPKRKREKRELKKKWREFVWMRECG